MRAFWLGPRLLGATCLEFRRIYLQSLWFWSLQNSSDLTCAKWSSGPHFLWLLSSVEITSKFYWNTCMIKFWFGGLRIESGDMLSQTAWWFLCLASTLLSLQRQYFLPKTWTVVFSPSGRIMNTDTKLKSCELTPENRAPPKSYPFKPMCWFSIGIDIFVYCPLWSHHVLTGSPWGTTSVEKPRQILPKKHPWTNPRHCTYIYIIPLGISTKEWDNPC